MKRRDTVFRKDTAHTQQTSDEINHNPDQIL